MNKDKWRKNLTIIKFQSLAIVLSMTLLLGWVGWLLGGQTLAFMAAGVTIFIYIANPMISPAVLLKANRSRKLGTYQAPWLHAVINTLAERAGLSNKPSLYLHSNKYMNAFTVGDRSQAAIALSESLLQQLDQREIAAVLAHEISHIRNNDTQIMGFTAIISRLVRTFSWVGQFLLLINLPLLLFGGFSVSWTTILLLIIAPTISMLLQLALSRTREYNADLAAAELTGNPEALASALVKIENSQQGFFKQAFYPINRRPAESSLWRTHPPTSKRVRRLLDMGQSSDRIRRLPRQVLESV